MSGSYSNECMHSNSQPEGGTTVGELGIATEATEEEEPAGLMLSPQQIP